MKRVIDTTEVVGTVEAREGRCEVCAEADAGYDEEAARLVVKLDAFLRTTDLRAKERRLLAEWLPKPQTVQEHVGREEGVAMAREIFQRWARKVKEAIPAHTCS